MFVGFDEDGCIIGIFDNYYGCIKEYIETNRDGYVKEVKDIDIETLKEIFTRYENESWKKSTP